LEKPLDLITDHQALLWINTLDVAGERGCHRGWMEIMQHIRSISSIKLEMAMADHVSRVGVMGIWLQCYRSNAMRQKRSR
jgi:hypothetical protein